MVPSMTSPPRMWRTADRPGPAIFGAIDGPNLVLILLDVARARSTGNRISADTATHTPAAALSRRHQPALRRTDRHTTNYARNPPPVVTSGEDTALILSTARTGDNAANVREHAVTPVHCRPALFHRNRKRILIRYGGRGALRFVSQR